MRCRVVLTHDHTHTKLSAEGRATMPCSKCGTGHNAATVAYRGRRVLLPVVWEARMSSDSDAPAAAAQ